MDLNYEPTAFSPLLSAPAAFGDLLGTVSPAETIAAFDTAVIGMINLHEVSLLSSAKLSALQGAPPIGFTLATIHRPAPRFPPLAPPYWLP